MCVCTTCYTHKHGISVVATATTTTTPAAAFRCRVCSRCMRSPLPSPPPFHITLYMCLAVNSCCSRSLAVLCSTCASRRTRARRIEPAARPHGPQIKLIKPKRSIITTRTVVEPNTRNFCVRSPSFSQTKTPLALEILFLICCCCCCYRCRLSQFHIKKRPACVCVCACVFCLTRFQTGESRSCRCRLARSARRCPPVSVRVHSKYKRRIECSTFSC